MPGGSAPPPNRCWAGTTGRRNRGGPRFRSPGPACSPPPTVPTTDGASAVPGEWNPEPYMPTAAHPCPQVCPDEGASALEHTTNSAGAPASSHVLHMDYTNNSAQILDAAGHCVAIYSGVGGRSGVKERITADGWLLSPGGTWTYTSPPDGRQHPVRRAVTPHPAASVRPCTTQAPVAARPLRKEPSCPVIPDR